MKKLPLIKSNEVGTIAGKRGMGKSTIARMIGKLFKKLIVYDPMFEYGMLGTRVRNLDDIGQLDKVVYSPMNNTLEELEKFCDWVWIHRKNVMVILDEIDEHAKGNFLPPKFGRLCRLGRHKGLGVVGITRRIANLNKTLPALSHHIISFRQNLPNDIEYLAEFIGKQPASKIMELEKYQYIWYEDERSTFTIGKTKPVK